MHQQGVADIGGMQPGTGASRSRGVDDRTDEAVASQPLEMARQRRIVHRQHARRPDRLVAFQHCAASQQQEADLDAMRPGELPPDMQQQALRAGREGVVADQQDAPGSGGCTVSAYRARGGVEVGGPMMQVRLEVGAFRPLVPCVDADDRTPEERMCPGLAHQPLEPRLVLRGRRAVHHQAAALAPCIVVPGRARGTDQRVIRRRCRQRLRDDLVVVIDLGVRTRCPAGRAAR